MGMRVWCVLRKNLDEDVKFGHVSEARAKVLRENYPEDWDGWYPTGRAFDLNQLTGRCRIRETSGGQVIRELEWIQEERPAQHKVRIVPKIKKILGFGIHWKNEEVHEVIPAKVEVCWIRDDKLEIKWEKITEVPC